MTTPLPSLPRRFARCVAALALVSVLAALVLLPSCATPAGVVFAPLPQPLIWPTPPEPARLSYVGQLTGSADLKPARTGWENLGETLFGHDEPWKLVTPFALCTDGGDRLFVADTGAQVVQVFNFQTRAFQQWRPGAPDAKDGHFEQPVAVAYDPTGRLLVSDSIAGVLYVFDSEGKMLGQLGKGILQRPCGLAIEPGTRRIYVADATAHQVVVLSPDGQLVERIGRRGMALGEFNYPTAVTLDSQGRLYVSDALNFRIQQFDARHQPLRCFGRQGDMPGYFAQPKGLAVDAHDHLYVLDAQFEAVQIFDDQGTLLLAVGEEGRKPGEFWLPTGIFIDPHHQRLWIADSYNRRVQVFAIVAENKP